MAKNVQTQSSFLRATFGPIIDPGFTAAPNLLLEHAAEMGISDKALLFMIQVQRAKYESKSGIINDTDLRMESSEKTLYRIRKDLAEIKDSEGKALIEIKSFYTKDDKGRVSGAGTSYDFSRLFDEIVKRFPPTGQNDMSDTPSGHFVRADSASVEPTGQNVRAIEDKMTDTLYKELEIKNYKTAHSEEIIHQDGEWVFYSDQTATYNNEPTKYHWDSLPRSLPYEVMAWRDALILESQKKRGGTKR